MRHRPELRYMTQHSLLLTLAPVIKQQGLAHTSLRKLMAMAGRSTGTFYSQFDTRDALLRALLEVELENTRDRFASRNRLELLEALGYYLHPSHANDPANGCILPALANEIARADTATRRTCEQGLGQLHEDLAGALGDPAAAWAVLSQAIGAVLLTRTLASLELREEVLEANLSELSRRYPAEPRGATDTPP